MDRPTVTVAIVTARKNEDTRYAEWLAVRKALVAGTGGPFGGVDVQADEVAKIGGGEFGRIMSTCLLGEVEHHTEHQLVALLHGSELPDEVLIVDRLSTGRSSEEVDDSHGRSFRMTIVPPMISRKELEQASDSSMSPSVSGCRERDVSFGCSDKNTAIVMCKTDILIMLDDCCLPSLSMVEAVRDTIGRNRNAIIPMQHVQLYLPTPDRPFFERATANMAPSDNLMTAAEAARLRRVFGVWAMHIDHILAVNGFNTDLDGSRVGLDEELLIRMDRYAEMRELKYVFSNRVRCYELQHGMPWKSDCEDVNWRPLCPSGFRAPGASLSSIRDRLMAIEYERARNAEEEDDDFDDED